MSLFPIFLKLDGRPCLVVGAGVVALEKITSLLQAAANIYVVAPDSCAAVEQLASSGQITFDRRPFQEDDVEGKTLIVTATNSREVNRAVFLAAQRRGILCNSADDPPNCDFYFASIVQRGPLQIAISTAGESPALAQRLRREIDAQLPPDIARWLAEVGALRREILAVHPPGEERKALLHRLAQLPACAAEQCPARQLAFSADLPAERPKTAAEKGTVYLVGAGPGDPELLTLRAARLLAAADVILHDDLVPRAILDLAGSKARVVSVGKRCGARRITQEQIHTLMVQEARRGFSVVRLKSGDPLVFGRAGEEMDALDHAGIPFEVVSGVTAMFAAAAAARKSLTDRRSASKIILTTAHHAPHDSGHSRPAVWRGALPQDATLGIYMPGRDLGALAWDLMASGLSPDLPCVVVSHISMPDQQMQSSLLGNLGDLQPDSAPLLILAGWPLRSTSEAVIPGVIQEQSPEEFPQAVSM